MSHSSVLLASNASEASSKLFGVVLTVAIFVAVLFVVFVIAGKVTGRLERPLAITVLAAPAVILALAGLVIPAILTINSSFTNEQQSDQAFRLVDGNGKTCQTSAPGCHIATYHKDYVGLANYKTDFTDTETLHTLLRTLLWIVVVPLITVVIGLMLALLLDRMKHTALPRTLIFLPTAISFVGASLIWNLVYDAPNDPPAKQTGLLSQIAIKLGWSHPPNWLLSSPANSFLLMIILVWIEVGFAMVVLGAALKAIPEEILEAARMDGATGATLFRTVQIPMIRNTLVVVVTTVTIASLKIFDIVNTLYNGSFNLDVLSNKMYNDLFVTNQTGVGSSLAVILFLFVIPLVAYNVRQIRRERATR